jgi:hypothetical protein
MVRGMDMAMKEKLFVLWILAVVAFSFFFSHFWSWTVSALSKVVALGFISLPALAMFAAGICGLYFLP